MIRKLTVIGLLLACLTPLLHAKGGRKSLDLYDYSKGLDSYHNPTTLPDGFVQRAQNGLFDDIAPFTKRKGYTVAWTTTTTFAYTGLWTYTDASNTTWQLARSSAQITASNLAGSVVKIATVSASNFVGETNAFGYAYFVDQAQGVYYWNGTSTTYVGSSSPRGSIITQFHNRLWVSGAAAPNGNQLYGSKYYDGTTWTTGTNATDPVQYSVGLQDNFDNTTAMYVYLDTLYLFKHYSIFALYGFDQTNFQISHLTQECGCIDGGSIQTYNGGLKFVSLRGIENFNGYTCTRISDAVKNLVDPAIQLGGFSQQSWIQSSASDFNGGSRVNTDTTTTSGSVQLYTNKESFSSLSSWVQTNTLCSGGFVLGGIGVYPSGANPACIETASTTTISGLATGFTIHASFKFLSNISDDVSIEWIATPYSVHGGTGYGIEVVGDGSNHIAISGGHVLNGTGLVVADVSSVTAVAQDSSIHTAALSKSSTGFFNLYLDDILRGSWQDASFYAGMNGFLLLNSCPGGGCNITTGVQFSEISISTPSGTYYSAVNHATTLTSWGAMTVTESIVSPSSITYYTRASTNPFTVTSSTPAWVSQTKNALISASTGTYMQLRADEWMAGAPTSPLLNDFTLTWFTGANAIPMASTVWDNRYWLSLTTTTADSANDAVLVLNSRGAWSLFDIHAGAFTQYRNSLYHADSAASGSIYLDNQGYGDNGNSINAFVKSKNLALGSLAADDYMYVVYPSARNTGSCAMTVQYDMDNSGTDLSLGSPLLSEFATSSSARLPFPLDSSHQDFGQSINFTVGTNDASCAWEYYGLTGLYRERSIQ